MQTNQTFQQNKKADITQEMASIVSTIRDNVESNIAKVIIGKEAVIEKLMIALLAGGHVLIEDVPGIGKTTLVRAFARSLSLDFKRIQFTPDLMPSDVTGFNIYHPKREEFVFQEGAVMAQIVLADEINRSAPQTQSSLLEAMQEGQVTVDGVKYTLPDPFMVLATQNPIEQVGTYPLPEAQLDRFMMRFHVGYPSIEEEMEIVEIETYGQLRENVQAVVSQDEVRWMRALTRQVHIADPVKRYLVDLCRMTRERPGVSLGASPRAGQMLLQASKARALLHNRLFVTPDDIKALAEDILSHRIILNYESRGKGIEPSKIVQSILQNLPVPR